MLYAYKCLQALVCISPQVIYKVKNVEGMSGLWTSICKSWWRKNKTYHGCINEFVITKNIECCHPIHGEALQSFDVKLHVQFKAGENTLQCSHLKDMNLDIKAL